MYVKLIDGIIYEAPVNKDGICNYNLDVDRMIADGYKLFIEAEVPTTNRMYHYEYAENPDNITEIIVYDETQEQADARELEQAKLAKYQENDAKADEKRYNQEFTITIQDQDCTFDTSSKTQADLLTAFAVCSSGETYEGWVTNNGIELDLTLEDVALISGTFKELSNVYPKWNEYKKQIDDATTASEVNSIVINY